MNNLGKCFDEVVYCIIRVFPAEACETIGGEACGWENMFPEVRLQQASLNNQNPVASSEEIDREYLDYADSKTYVSFFFFIQT